MKASDVGKKIGELLKNKYMLCIVLVGAVLLLLPTGGGNTGGEGEEVMTDIEAPAFSLVEQEKKLEDVLKSIEGAGDVTVMLSLKTSVSRELAEDGDELLVVSTGSGTQSAVALSYLYPEYQGAVVVCSGAGDARVKLAVTQAVASVTGLGSDKITVIKMK